MSLPYFLHTCAATAFREVDAKALSDTSSFLMRPLGMMGRWRLRGIYSSRLIISITCRADDRTAKEYNLEGGATLHLVLALRGGC